MACKGVADRVQLALPQRRGVRPRDVPAGAPAVIAFTLVRGLLLFFVVVFFPGSPPWSLVRPCSLVLVLPDRWGVLQDVVDFPSYIFDNRGTEWNVQNALDVMNLRTVQRIRRQIRDCTHPKTRTTFFIYKYSSFFCVQDLVGWSMNMVVYPNDPWDRDHALQMVRTSPARSLVFNLRDSTPPKKPLC